MIAWGWLIAAGVAGVILGVVIMFAWLVHVMGESHR